MTVDEIKKEIDELVHMALAARIARRELLNLEHRWAAPFRACPAPTLLADAPHDQIAALRAHADALVGPCHAKLDAIIRGR